MKSVPTPQAGAKARSLAGFLPEMGLVPFFLFIVGGHYGRIVPRTNKDFLGAFFFVCPR